MAWFGQFMGKQLRFSISDREYERIQVAVKLSGRSEPEIASAMLRAGMASVLEEVQRLCEADNALGLRSPQPEYHSLCEAILANWDFLLENCQRIDPQRLIAIRDGKAEPSEVELLRLANALGVSEEYLEGLPECQEACHGAERKRN